MSTYTTSRRTRGQHPAVVFRDYDIIQGKPGNRAPRGRMTPVSQLIDRSFT